MGIPQGEEREKVTEQIFEAIMTEFPQMNIKHQIIDPAAQGTPSEKNAKNTTNRHIIVKLQKVKERKYKEVRRRKYLSYRETNIS